MNHKSEEEVKPFLFVVNRIFYTDNHKESIKNIELRTEFNKDAGYRITILKNYFYTLATIRK